MLRPDKIKVQADLLGSAIAGRPGFYASRRYESGKRMIPVYRVCIGGLKGRPGYGVALSCSKNVFIAALGKCCTKREVAAARR